MYRGSGRLLWIVIVDLFQNKCLLNLSKYSWKILPMPKLSSQCQKHWKLSALISPSPPYWLSSHTRLQEGQTIASLLLFQNGTAKVYRYENLRQNMVLMKSTINRWSHAQRSLLYMFLSFRHIIQSLLFAQNCQAMEVTSFCSWLNDMG